MREILSNQYVEALLFTAVMLLLLKINGRVFRTLKKRRNNSAMAFLEGVIRALIIIAIVVRILNLWSGFSKFSNQILMSSSLLIVVLGFVFQEGLSNIVHGLILLVFKPFEIGDRVRVTVNGTELTGYVTTINLRSTVIRNLINSASLIVPNAAMDTAVIENAHYAENAYTTGLIDLSVTYESDLDLAVRTAADVIAANPAVRAARADRGENGPVSVIVRDLGESGISLRCSVLTHTPEENYQACSDLRLALWRRFQEEDGLEFAYPHMQILEETEAGQKKEACDVFSS